MSSSFNGLACAEKDNDQNLQRGDKIANAPIRPQQLAELDPKSGKAVILFVKVFYFVSLAPKRPHHANTGEIFLDRCGKRTLGFVCRKEPAEIRLKNTPE